MSLALVLCWITLSTTACVRQSRLPFVLSDKEYWGLIEALSEPPGTFALSDNLVSNEPGLAENVRKLGPTRAFCGSLAALPAAPGARFIERDSVRLLTSKLSACPP